MIASLLSAAAPTIPAPPPQIPWMLFAGIAVGVILVGGVLLFLALRKSANAEEPCQKCGKMLMAEWPRCMFCKTPRGTRRATLEVVSGPMSGQTIGLDAEVTTIGTASNSTVAITDSGVSRKHAGIKKNNEGVFEVADLGSTNGIYVNGQKVPKKQLQLGDVIRIGTTEMVFKG